MTTNGTVDTTLISSLLVNVSGGGGGEIYKLMNPASVTGTDSEFYVTETENYFYFFGRVYFDSISSGTAIFTFPFFWAQGLLWGYLCLQDTRGQN